MAKISSNTKIQKPQTGEKMHLFVVDGNWYLHRLFFALKTSRPLEEALPYAFISLICKDAMKVRATHILICFDGPDVFRYKVYPDYKIDRQEAKAAAALERDDDEPGKEIYAYLPAVRAYTTKVGLKWAQQKIYEADDLLVSAAHQWSALYPGIRITLGAQDKDLYQALTSLICLYDSSAKPEPRRIKVADAERKKGVPVAQMVDYQTLLGDSIDSIPGFPGMGAGKIKAVLNKYGSIRNWYAKGSAEDKLWLTKNQVALKRNRELVTMVATAAIPTDAQVLRLAKVVEGSKDFPVTWHLYNGWLYPKTKGLFG